MSGPDIFLSYNREDADVARRYAEAFKAEGFDVWWDAHLRSGEAYDEVTEKALRGAKAVVVLWSPRSVESRWVRAEATLADRNKVLVPAMIEPCERPIMFELTQTAELSHWDGDPFDRPWQAFLTDVRGFVERGRAKEAPAAPTAVSPAPRKEPGRPSIAIMPFTNRSGEKADDVFAEGMVEDLIAALSTGHNQIKVISQSATRTYRDVAYDVKQVGEELGARYLLEGNVRRVGADLRVTAQLVEAANGAILWTQKFDRPVSDLATLQEDLAVDVAGTLGVQVKRVEIERALRKPGDLTAWEATIRARALTFDQTREAMERAVEEARKAVALAPDYAPAHAQLALSGAINLWQVRGGRDEGLRKEINEAAKQALKLEPSNPAVLSDVAEALCIIRSWNEGRSCAERAYQIAPDNEASHMIMIAVSIYDMKPEEALKHIEAADRLAPRALDMHVRLIQRSAAYYMLGDYEKALEANHQALMFNPAFEFALKDVAIFKERLGLRDDAIAALRMFRERMPGVTLDFLERFHTESMLAPQMAREMFETLSTVWHAAEEEESPGGTAKE